MMATSMSNLWDRRIHVPLAETKAGTVVAITLSLLSMAVLAVCLTRRVQNVKDFKRLPLVCWLVIIIYIDSIAFVSGTSILSNGFGVDSSALMCSRAILLCLGCYMTTKVLLYYFLVERVYIIRRSPKPRLRDPLYLFNSFGMLIPYLVVIALNFYFRFAIYEDGTCRIGMKKLAMIPLIAFDVLVNVYLTSLFLFPLRATYSYQNNRHSNIRTVALRTFIGSCATLISSVVNLTMLVILQGEPGWICLMCCNCDILFSVLALHWITSKDNASTMSSQEASVQVPTLSKRTPTHQGTFRDSDTHELGRKEQRNRGGITTFVTASNEDDDEIEKIQVPPNAITVESTHIREVYELGYGNGSRRNSQSQESGSESLRKTAHGSTDDFFRKY